jgi:glycerophosphoryl diester phosphodiesterase
MPAVPIATDALIIGAGPCGLFQIFELGLLGIHSEIVDSLPQPGGQCAALYPTKPIYDIPGLPYCTAQELVDNLLRQAAPFDAGFHLGEEVTTLRAVDDRLQAVTSAGTEFHARTVFIAAGVGSFRPRRLRLPNAPELEGRHLAYRVTDPDRYAGKRIVILGGGDSALDWANELAPRAARLTLVHRRDEFRAAAATLGALRERARDGNVEIITPATACRLGVADGRLVEVDVALPNKVTRTLKADELLVEPRPPPQGDPCRHGEVSDQHPGRVRRRRHQHLPGQEETDPQRFSRGGAGRFRREGAARARQESAPAIHDDEPGPAQAARGGAGVTGRTGRGTAPKVPLIIAHRGACAYLPEHSRGAKALAYAMGADYLEQDVIATRDGELVVLHDNHLDVVSDVAARFPGRARADGHFYCIDFDLAELRALRFHERIDPATGVARWRGRYPPAAGGFTVATLNEEIEFVAALNRATGRNVGIYPEIKNPEWHLTHGFDLGAAMLELLERHGYLAPGRRIYLQCFDPDTLRRARQRAGPDLPVIQLIGSKTSVTDELLRDVAAYATGIGPSLKLLYLGRDDHGEPRLTTLVERARSAGLVVHPYTLRADELPDGVESFDDLLTLCIDRLGVDAVFTDFTDKVAAFLARSRATRGPSSAASRGT